MTKRDNILQELKELNSQLASYQPDQTYTVPNGYFEGLIGQVMLRIRALEAANAAEELKLLSPVLSRLSKSMPYTVPAGYFDQLEERLEKVTGSEENSSSVLNSLDKQMPYQVPAGYFDGLADRILQAVQSTEYKTVQDVAGAWGFWHLSQFSADYQRFFNELPSQTLAKRGEVFQKIIVT